MLSKLTLLGLHKYTDGSIWDNFNLPDGLDKEIAISEILRQASEFSVLYPDPDFLTNMIGQFCDKWYFTFEKWYAAINEEYNPLWNVEAHISIGDQGTREGTSKATTHSEGDNVHKNAAYDTDQFKNAEKDTHDDSGNSSGSFNEAESNAHEEYRRGNIGVTMSQQLLMAEIDVRTWNIYQHIADIFCNEMCICIYN